MNKIFLFAITLIFFSNGVTFARALGDESCIKINSKLRDFLEVEEFPNKEKNQQSMRLNDCLNHNNDACIYYANFEKEEYFLWQHSEAGDALIEPEIQFAHKGVVQLRQKKAVICIAALYSGGSSASWIFAGWKLQNGKVAELPNVSKYVLQSDAVLPKELYSFILSKSKKDNLVRN